MDADEELARRLQAEEDAMGISYPGSDENSEPPPGLPTAAFPGALPTAPPPDTDDIGDTTLESDEALARRLQAEEDGFYESSGRGGGSDGGSDGLPASAYPSGPPGLPLAAFPGGPVLGHAEADDADGAGGTPGLGAGFGSGLGAFPGATRPVSFVSGGLLDSDNNSSGGSGLGGGGDGDGDGEDGDDGEASAAGFGGLPGGPPGGGLPTGGAAPGGPSGPVGVGRGGGPAPFQLTGVGPAMFSNRRAGRNNYRPPPKEKLAFEDDGTPPLASVSPPSLRDLALAAVINCDGLSEDALRTIADSAKLKDLLRLRRDHNPRAFTDRVLQPFLQLELDELDLEWCVHVSNTALQVAGLQCPNLTIVNLRWCPRVSDSGVEALAEGCGGITKIDLSFCSLLTNATLSTLASKLTHLTHLSLSSVWQLTDAGAREFALMASTLEYLDVGGAHDLGDEAVSAIATCTKLKHLNIAGFSGLTSGAFVKLANLSDLVYFNCSGCAAVGDDAFQTVFSALVQLESLHCFGCLRLGDGGVAAALDASECLSELHLSNCVKVSDDILRRILETAITSLVEFSASGCPKLNPFLLGEIDDALGYRRVKGRHVFDDSNDVAEVDEIAHI